MTPEGIITAAKKRSKDTTSNLDWNLFFQITIDRIFGYRVWKFATNEFNYIHSVGVAEKTFSATATERALNHIRSIRLTTSYTDVLGIPVPASGTAHTLDVVTPQEFFARYPDNVVEGEPQIATIRVNNDGTNGMQISIAPLPNIDSAVWVFGDFIPAYTIDTNPMPILPLQFHWLVVDGVASLACEELGKPALSGRLSERVWGVETGGRVVRRGGIHTLEDWDRKNPAHKPRLSSDRRYDSFRGPSLPENFDRRSR